MAKYKKIELVNESGWPISACLAELAQLLEDADDPFSKGVPVYAVIHDIVARVAYEVKGDFLKIVFRDSMEGLTQGVIEEAANN